jgi:hypothetical protein
MLCPCSGSWTLFPAGRQPSSTLLPWRRKGDVLRVGACPLSNSHHNNPLILPVSLIAKLYVEQSGCEGDRTRTSDLYAAIRSDEVSQSVIPASFMFQAQLYSLLLHVSGTLSCPLVSNSQNTQKNKGYHIKTSPTVQRASRHNTRTRAAKECR